MQLYEAARGYPSVSFIGMCKNAGKTTALNRFIESADDRVLALTSVGRDGESTDLVTRTPKPLIFVKEGTLIATARDLLRGCTAGKQLLATTGIYTALGEVVVFRARSAGFVELAGPSTVAGLHTLHNILGGLGAQLTLVDGALSRKSLCSVRAAAATVLSTGASYDRSLEKTVGDTAVAVKLLTMPAAPYLPLNSATTTAFFRRPAAAAPASHNDNAVGQEETDDPLASFKRGAAAVYVAGALTDRLLLPLLKAGAFLKDKTFVVEDPGKVLASYGAVEAFWFKGGAIEALAPVNLLGVTYNPVSAYGYEFDDGDFGARLKDAVGVPVYNVLKGE